MHRGNAVFVNGDEIRNGARSAAMIILVKERADLPFVAKPIVVMSIVQAEVLGRDIRVGRGEFAQRGADAVVSPGIEETDMEWRVHVNVRVVGAKYRAGVPKIKGLLATVLFPVKMDFGLIQELQILLIGLLVNQHVRNLLWFV